ncbi:MAG: DNA-directed DNA polymerase II small subunit [Promethearchaeota archaeon]
MSLNRKLIQLCYDSNLLISPETFQFIKTKDQPFEFLQKTIGEITKSDKKPLVLTMDYLKKIVQQKFLFKESSNSVSSKKKFPNPPSEAMKIPILEVSEDHKKELSSSFSPENFSAATQVQIKDNITILKDPTGLMLGEGKIKDIKTYFQDRFEKLRILLLKRPDCKGAMTLKQVKGQNKSENTVKVIGLVLEKKELIPKSNGKIRNNVLNSINIMLDDLESTLSVIFSGKNEALIKKANKIVVDQVICVEGFMTEQNTLIASDVFKPDIPHHPKKKHEIPPITTIFLSDIHFGSKYFLSDKFEVFLDWLHGKSEIQSQKELAKWVKYIIIAGDLIDGVGVYPNQDKNLAIIDISGQYNLAAKYLNRIPKHIKIIIIPGGPHDAVRKSYPQAALNIKYAKALYQLKNVILLGNPAYVSLHGVKVLIFHGDSFDDLIQVIHGLSYEKSSEMMKELLINRHLTPIYGYSTWIAPESEDWMVIEDIPDIFHCGHTHISDFKEYRGVLMLNSGTFQAETDYQRSLGIKPTPGKIPIVNLQTLKVKFLQF